VYRTAGIGICSPSRSHKTKLATDVADMHNTAFEAYVLEEEVENLERLTRQREDIVSLLYSCRHGRDGFSARRPQGTCWRSLSGIVDGQIIPQARGGR
jgi:hypothetical protein